MVIAKKKICRLCDKEYISRKNNKLICPSCLLKITGEKIVRYKPKYKNLKIMNFNNGVIFLSLVGICIIIFAWLYSCSYDCYENNYSRHNDIHVTEKYNYHNQFQYDQLKHHRERR